MSRRIDPDRRSGHARREHPRDTTLARTLFLVALLVLAPHLASAQTPPAQGVPEARDIPFPGFIALSVNATDPERAIFRVHETIPVTTPGRLTLLYPKWIPGNHAPTGPIDRLTGLVARANGQPLEWRRDPVDMYAFHFDPPAGASAVDIDFEYVSPTAKNQGRIEAIPDMLDLHWSNVALYPAGYYVRQIPVEASVRLPPDWKFATALDIAASDGGRTIFKTTSFETLIDSPLLAGRYFRQIDLDPKGRSPVRLDVVADSASGLELKPDKIAALRKLVREVDALFGARHYDHYDFLFSMSDRLGGIGLEHHRSSENGVTLDYFENLQGLSLLPHEYVHSWNGKFRRGADLWTPDYRTPMQNSLLWVYEGQTQYWGEVLAARSGLLTKEQALDNLALDAAYYAARVGRAWRPLSDTTNAPITASRGPQAWRSWQRAEDYYVEGLLIWLDADTLIRERTNGKKSLDDFARSFFGMDDGVWTTKTYVFDDLVAALNAIAPYDWSGFFKARLDGHGAAPLDGLARGGYRLVYRDEPTEFERSIEKSGKYTDFSFSLGLTIGEDGQLNGVLWEGPAFKAGLTVGDKLIAVDNEAYSAKRLKDAITAAKGGPPIELLIRNGDRFRTLRIDYRGGLRYPRLERIDGTPARLDAILKPRS